MTQPDRTIHPAIAGIWATVRQKIYERLQERPLYRRTVAVVDADNAAQSTHLSIPSAGSVIRSNMIECQSHGHLDLRSEAGFNLNAIL